MQTVSLPSCVRIKAGALARVGIYLRRAGIEQAVVLVSEGLPGGAVAALEKSLAESSVAMLERLAIVDASVEQAVNTLERLPTGCQAVVGMGGGKALDTAKYVAFLAAVPYCAIPTSLSNDGFCSPQSSLTLAGRRRSLAAHLPAAVIVDTQVCLAAPRELWWSGVGDLAAKLTAVRDWKLAFHAVATPVNDLAALLSDATVFQFLARPERDEEGVRLLATALMLNGIAMEVAGSSRPASGSEHLISHALDRISSRPRLHGLQVGVATYLCSLLQQQATHTIAALFERTGFWQAIEADPFSRREWLEAVDLAPQIKPNFYTILSARPCRDEVARWLDSDPRLKSCFTS